MNSVKKNRRKETTIPMRIARDTVVTPRYKRQERRQLTPPVHVPLTVFDTVTYNTNLSVVFAYKAPTVSNVVIINGLRDVLAEYREWAGRIGRDETGRPAIVLNDKGVRVVEAMSESTLDQAVPCHPSPQLAELHLSGEGAKELLQVKLVRFACGGLAMGLTANHLVADGHSTCLFWVAWGRATRGLNPLVHPHHNRSLFVPRDPLRVDFDHYGVEYLLLPDASTSPPHCSPQDSTTNIVIHRIHFSMDFIKKVKAKASKSCGTSLKSSYSTFESLVAHIWRAITKARRLDEDVISRVRISVNGRSRLTSLSVPDGYFGNVVLWAFPCASVRDIQHSSIHLVADVIHEAVAGVDDRYFRSFIDFCQLHKDEVLVPTAEMENRVLCPNMEVDSWLRFPFYDVDFGSGGPDIFTPSWLPYEGFLVLLPSSLGDGSVDVVVPLRDEDMILFYQFCYNLEL